MSFRTALFADCILSSTAIRHTSQYHKKNPSLILKHFSFTLARSGLPSFATSEKLRSFLVTSIEQKRHSHMAFPDSPNISHKKVAMIHLCIVTVHDLCRVLRPCFILIQTRQAQCWSYHCPVCHHGIPFLLPPNVSHSSTALASVGSSPPTNQPSCSFFHFSGSFFSLQTQQDASCAPLRHHRRQCHCSVTSDPCGRGCIRIPKNTNFT